jgi:hypothetical protein
LPHSVGLLNAFNCPVLSLLAHSAICPKLQSASLCHLPHLSLFPLVFPLFSTLYSALFCRLSYSALLPILAIWPTTSYPTLCSLFPSALSSPLQCSTLHYDSLYPTLPSASLCPLLHSHFCSPLTSAFLCPFLYSDFLFHSDLSSTLPPPLLCFCSTLTSTTLCPQLHSALFSTLTSSPLYPSAFSFTLPSPSVRLFLYSDPNYFLPSATLCPFIHYHLCSTLNYSLSDL